MARIPTHDHSGFNEGGLIANSAVVQIVAPGVTTGGTSGPVSAADVSVADYAGLYDAVNVEAALAEVETDLGAHLTDATDAHDASAVSFDPTGLVHTAATDVQAAIADLDGAVSAGGPLCNYAATTDPAVTDDSGDGYSIGSRWVNTSTDEEFVCTDATVGAAVWVSTTAGGGGGDTTGHIGADFDGQGLPLAVDKPCYGVVPYTGTITDWRILVGGAAGDVAFDVAIHAAGARPVFPTDSIVAAAPPSMTSDTEVSGSTLTGWSTAVTAGDNYAIKVTSATVEWASLTVNYSRP